MKPFSILGIEYELGENKIDIKNIFEKPERIIERTGIECVYETNKNAEHLALKAANKLLNKISVSPDVLIYVTQSQKYVLPGSGVLVHDELKLNKNCLVFDINAGCSGFVQALILATNMIDSFKNILIICADRYRSKLDINDRSTRAVFSDGASAILISSNPKIKISFLKNQTAGNLHGMLVQHKVDQENEGKLKMSGRELWNFTRENIVPDINEVLTFFEKNKIICENIFIHQASKVVVDGIEKDLLTNAPKLHRNYHNRGNTVSSTIPILIKDSLVDLNNKNSILSGFGVGLLSYTLGIEKI
tara:strand:+ start:853 stop:1764 length:912 start_codon:yes stop_codon:yes gene_type:complete